MRAFIYILFCGVLFSCSNANKSEMMVETAAEVVGNADAPIIASETFQYETITKQKLQELFDLKTLAKEHPEDAAIKAQVALLSDTFKYSNLGELVSIESIQPLERVNDSTNKQQIEFISKNSDGNIFKGSITAIITSKMFILDGIEQVATKVVFKE